MSRNALIAAIQRGEVPVMTVGRRVFVCWPALQLKALGVTDIGAFCRSLGVKDVDGLLSFLGYESDPT